MNDRSPADALPPLLIVAGHGRSGTNMVLDMLDCHRMTFCRNEPNELIGSAFRDLGDPMFGDPEPQNFVDQWHAAIARTIKASGARDRFGLEKDYFRSATRAKLGQAAMARRRIRGAILPRAGGVTVEEWPCPAFYYDHAALSRALPVLKILLAPAWIIRAHALFPSQHVVHVVRHPGSFAQSWWSRYVTGIGGGPEKVFADNLPSLTRILDHFGHQNEMPQSYSLEALVVSELWRWRYMNETVADALSASPRYLMASYDAVMADKLHWADKIYALAGLDLSEQAHTAIAGQQNTLFAKRKADGLDPEWVAQAIEQVMADSPWRATWAPET